MTRIYLPSTGAEDWRSLLASPERHWREGHFAMSLAPCWEACVGLRPEIAAQFADVDPAPELLIALPEHKVLLPGEARGRARTSSSPSSAPAGRRWRLPSRARSTSRSTGSSATG